MSSVTILQHASVVLNLLLHILCPPVSDNKQALAAAGLPWFSPRFLHCICNRHSNTIL